MKEIIVKIEFENRDGFLPVKSLQSILSFWDEKMNGGNKCNFKVTEVKTVSREELIKKIADVLFDILPEDMDLMGFPLTMNSGYIADAILPLVKAEIKYVSAEEENNKLMLIAKGGSQDLGADWFNEGMDWYKNRMKKLNP